MTQSYPDSLLRGITEPRLNILAITVAAYAESMLAVIIFVDFPAT